MSVAGADVCAGPEDAGSDGNAVAFADTGTDDRTERRTGSLTERRTGNRAERVARAVVESGARGRGKSDARAGSHDDPAPVAERVAAPLR